MGTSRAPGDSRLQGVRMAQGRSSLAGFLALALLLATAWHAAAQEPPKKVKEFYDGACGGAAATLSEEKVGQLPFKLASRLSGADAATRPFVTPPQACSTSWPSAGRTRSPRM